MARITDSALAGHVLCGASSPRHVCGGKNATGDPAIGADVGAPSTSPVFASWN